MTPREQDIRDSLERIEDKLDDRMDRIETRMGGIEKAHNIHTVEDERRFGRIDRLLVGIAVAVASPKIGGPDVAHVVSAAIQTVRS